MESTALNADGSPAEKYYLVINQIPTHFWTQFARLHLLLEEHEIDEISCDHSQSIREQKYQMILKWANKFDSEVNTAKKLLELLDKFKQTASERENVSSPAQMQHSKGDVSPGREGVLTSDLESDGLSQSGKKEKEGWTEGNSGGMPMAGNASNVHVTYNITNANVAIDSTNVKFDEKPSIPDDVVEQRTMSIVNVRHPTKGFVAEKSYDELRSKVMEKHVAVSLIHGYPGSGKSEVALKLAADFPYTQNDGVFVKHHIACSDHSDDVVQEMKNLLMMMLEHNLLQDKGVFQTAGSALEKSSAQEFVNLLILANVPVLMIIEDPPKKYIQLLADLIRSLDDVGKKGKSKTIHVYITSRYKSDCDCSDLSCSVGYQIDGLEVSEGLKLLDVLSSSKDEKESATKIIRKLSGSPLGLIAVKAACEKLRIKYSKYLEIMKNPSVLARLTRSKTSVLQGQSKEKDVFQAMILMLKPDDSDHDNSLWNTIIVLSFFHHGSIPQQLIGRVFESQMQPSDQASDDLDSRNMHMLESGLLITDLVDRNICKTDGNYTNTTVTFHQLVFNAIQVHLKEQKLLLSTLVQAIHAVGSLVHKDIRKPEDSSFMKKMLPHIQSVLEHVESNSSLIDEFVNRMIISHLYEVRGLLVTDFSVEEAEESLKRSLKIVWNESIGDQLSDDCLMSQQLPETRDEVAKKVVELCVKAGEELLSRKEDLNRYAAMVLQFKTNELEFLTKTASKPKVKEYLKKVTSYSLSIDPETLDQFRLSEKGKVFLDINIHCKIFYVERIASIQHTMARVILCDNSTISPEKRAKFIWISDVVIAICAQCLIQTNINLLLRILTATSGVGIRLAGLSTFYPTEKKKILFETREFALMNLKKREKLREDFYENALRKSVQRDFDMMSILRSIVRIDAKLLSLCDTNEKHEIANADDYYKDLSQRANNNREWNISSRCVVYCGKFLAAKKKYGEATKLFLKAFTLKGIKPNDPWVCYNYARSIVCGKLLDEKPHAITKCNEALKDQDRIADDLLKRLQEQVELLYGL